MTASLNPYISQYCEEFDAEKSSQYRMAIQCSLGGLSFALLDTLTHTLVALECYQSDLLADGNDLFRTLERALEDKGLNNKDFLSVRCLIDNRYCSLIPEPLFNETDRTKYLDFTFQIPDIYSIASERLTTSPCFNVYALLKTLRDKVLAKWPNASITHSSSVFVDSMMQRSESNGVFVNVRNRDFDMLVKKEGKLHFFNNFTSGFRLLFVVRHGTKRCLWKRHACRFFRPHPSCFRHYRPLRTLCERHPLCGRPEHTSCVQSLR